MLDPQANPPNWPLLEKIALIDPKDWDAGPKAVSDKITDLQVEFPSESETEGLQADGQPASIPSGSTSKAKAAMERNRRDLPPTLDAISALILLEIERMQQKNHQSDAERDEALRQVGVFVALYEAVEGLKLNLPDTGEVTADQAEASVSILGLYYRGLSQLPREKVAEVKEGLWNSGVATAQFGLIGALSGPGIYYGLPATAAMTAAAYCVAPKKAGEIIKLGKEALPTKS